MKRTRSGELCARRPSSGSILRASAAAPAAETPTPVSSTSRQVLNDLTAHHAIAEHDLQRVFGALGKTAFGGVPLAELAHLAAGRRFCATMDVPPSLARLVRRAVEFAPCVLRRHQSNTALARDARRWRVKAPRCSGEAGFAGESELKEGEGAVASAADGHGCGLAFGLFCECVLLAATDAMDSPSSSYTDVALERGMY
jgi:hypothetical protein